MGVFHDFFLVQMVPNRAKDHICPQRLFQKSTKSIVCLPAKSSLTHFSLVSHFYTPWKRQKTKGFLTLSGDIEMWHWTKMG